MNIRKSLTFLAAVSATLGATVARAEALPATAHVQADRCIAGVRDAVRDPGTTLIRHTITAIRTVGMRREFIIASTVYGSANPDGRSFVSRCLAERWGDGAELAWVKSGPGGEQLLARVK